jgi:hypothetical protein
MRYSPHNSQGRYFLIWFAKCLVGQMLVYQSSVGKYLLATCLLEKRSLGQMSVDRNVSWPNMIWPNVWLAKCLVGRMSGQPNVWLAKCLVGHMSGWPNVCWPNVCWPNVCWPNVCWPNVCRPNFCRQNVCRQNVFQLKCAEFGCSQAKFSLL